MEIKDGLPGINIRKITKDKYGFMWFATQDGVSRFDGKSFINLNSYKVNPNRKILGTDFYDLQPDIGGNYLWALSPYGGLNKIDIATCNVLKHYRIEQSVKPDTSLWYKCFTETDKHLIIGSYEGIVSRFNKASGRTDYSFSLAAKFGCDGQLQNVMTDGNKRVWFFVSGNGILITDSTLKNRVAFISAKSLDDNRFSFNDYAIFKNFLFITTSTGLKIIDINLLSPVSKAGEVFPFATYCGNKELHCISIDGSSAIISGVHLLYKINLVSKELQSIQFGGNYDDRAWLTLTNSIYLDKQNIWLGSQYGIGWIKNTQSPFVPYYNSFDGSNNKINHASTLCPINDSMILVSGDGLYLTNLFTSKMAKINSADFYYSAFSIKSDYFVASGVSKGLKLFDHNFNELEILRVFPELKAVKEDLLICSANFGDSVVFMASQNKNGLYIWNIVTRKLEVINTKSGEISLRNDDINRLFVDSKKRLWIVCENVVSIYDYYNKTIKHLSLADPTTKLPLAINMDICETKNGFWLATYGMGVIGLSDDFKLKKIYDAKDGLNNLGLYKIFNISDSQLITSSNNGLALINTKSGVIKNFSVQDGLQSNSFEETSGEKSGKSIFFGGINGFTRVEFAKINPQLTISKFTFSTITFTAEDNRVSDTLNINIKKIPIPDYITQVTINFSAINYSAPDKVKFAYRIAEKGDSWNFTSQSFIQSFRLNPGTYTLQVKAANEDGVWSDVKELQLIFLPKWYQTWLFKAGVMLVVAALLYALYRYRVRQILKVERMRQKLSSDLHDDIGSTLNSVNLFARMAMLQPESDEYLPHIKEGVQSAIASVRDIIWILDKQPETIESVFNRINAFAQPLAKAVGCTIETMIEPALRHYNLHGQEKQNVYLVMKEAVNNCIKYAGCRAIAVTAARVNNQLTISIADDGKGFEIKGGIAQIAEGGSGNGLKNMLLRCNEIKWKLTVESALGKGTAIKLTGKIRD